VSAITDLFVPGGAEALFGIELVELDAESAKVTMASGPWLLDDGRVSRASLAVAIDDVTGFVIAAGTEKGRWPVSVGIRMDFVSDPLTDDAVICVDGTLVSRDSGGGLTTGRVLDSAGGVVAQATQRSHLVTGYHPGLAQSVDIPAGWDGGDCIPEIFGIKNPTGTGRNTLELPPSAFTRNQMGNVHGGVLICVAELAALRALDAAPELVTASIDTVYMRPCAGDEPVVFRSEIVHSGRSLEVVQVVAENSAGKPCVRSTVITRRV
jgi:uncharacterized protein (TIGR00369 family)